LASSEFLLRPNTTLKIEVIAAGPVICYYCDGRKFFGFDDPQPYTNGWFAFRTVKSHFEVRHFRVYRLVLRAENGGASEN
jgi:hypothetical protein